jgi:hypothetical protein
MKALAAVLACLCVVLAVARVSLLTTRPSAAFTADKPAAAADDKPAAPQVGRYQMLTEGKLLDTATGRVWKPEVVGDEWKAHMKEVPK